MIDYIGTIEKDIAISRYCTVVICGCGATGKNILDYLYSIGMTKEIRFCDIDEKKINTHYRNVYIYRYQDVVKSDDDTVYLISNMDVRKTVQFLNQNKVKHIHIIRG